MEELLKFLKEKKKEYTDAINDSQHPLNACDKSLTAAITDICYASKAKAYQEIIDYIEKKQKK